MLQLNLILEFLSASLQLPPFQIEEIGQIFMVYKQNVILIQISKSKSPEEWNFLYSSFHAHVIEILVDI